MSPRIAIIIIIVGSTALGGSEPSQANIASDLYPGHPPANFYNPVSLRLPPPLQSILISVGHVLVDLQNLSTISFLVILCHPFVLEGSPTSVYWILLVSLYLIHCKYLLILYCISSATALPRILDHIFCEEFSFENTEFSFTIFLS